jgi:hypothetical protein
MPCRTLQPTEAPRYECSSRAATAPRSWRSENSGWNSRGSTRNTGLPCVNWRSFACGTAILVGSTARRRPDPKRILSAPCTSRPTRLRDQPVSSARAVRNSRKRGGLLSSRSACGGCSLAACKYCPQPVSRMMGAARRPRAHAVDYLASVDVGHSQVRNDDVEGLKCLLALKNAWMPAWPPSRSALPPEASCARVRSTPDHRPR